MNAGRALRSIPDLKPVRVYLPIKNHRQRYRTQAIYKTLSPPRFELRFQLGMLPLNDVDTTQACLINVDFGGPNVSMRALIAGVSSQTLEMTAEALISHEQMRDFFRVDTVTEVISRSFRPELFGRSEPHWSLQGSTIDISGNGLLATFPERPPDEDLVRLEITLPAAAPRVVGVLAVPVRSARIDREQWEIAYHFQDISEEDRDLIIGCCLELQRRHLRLHIDR